MDFSDHVGLIELVLVFSVAIGWGILELHGLRLDRKRDAEKKRLESAAPSGADSEPSSAQGSRHSESQHRLHQPGAESTER